MNTKRPHFLNKGISLRKWKAQKRKELKAVLKAVSEYQSGCSYCPGYDEDINNLFDTLEKMKESHSYKNWG